MSVASSSSKSSEFDTFYSEVKAIEKRDSVLTPEQQLNRLLRPGSTYFNLNPFEVLQIHSETPLDEAKKKYKKLSLLIHPDKNPDDRDRADQAFGIIKKALATIEDPDELARCKEIVTEARARTDLAVAEKRKKLKREGKPPIVEEDDPEKYQKTIQNLTTKLFAERERKKRLLEERANQEKKRKAEEDLGVAEKKRMEEEYIKNFEDSRDDRVGSWKKFQTLKEKKKGKYSRGIFKPPKPKLEQRL